MHLTKINLSLSLILISIIISLSINSSPEYDVLSHYPTFWIVSNVFAGSEDDKEDSERSNDDQEDEEGDSDKDEGGDSDKDEGGDQGPREDFVPSDGDQGPREDFVPSDGDREESDDRETRNDFQSPSFRPTPQVQPQDFCSREWYFSTPNEKWIISNLINLDSNSIRNYPYLMSLPFMKIKVILHCLDYNSLQKVLLNIPQNDLIKIYNGITPREFDQILNRLLPHDAMPIKSRLQIFP